MPRCGVSGAMLLLWAVTVLCATVNIKNTINDYSWDQFNNQAQIGDIAVFAWTGTHNVIQVMNGSDHSWSNWPGALRSGYKVTNGTFTWQITSDFRPGIYYFSSEDENMGVNIAAAAVGDHNTGNVLPFPCSTIGAGSSANCTVYEINNFQTHYDWIPYSWNVQQGDVVRFRWSDYRNVVQTDDVSNRTWNGGIFSGVKDYCVPGAGFKCINNPPSKGEYLWDTTGFRPGIYHFSDQDAPLDAGGNGMPALIDLRASAVVQDVPCCSVFGSQSTPKWGGLYATDCIVREVTNWDLLGGCGPYCWHPYIIAAQQWDVVRWRWSGNHSVFQVEKNSQNAPGTIKVSGGPTSGLPVNCIPFANNSCLRNVLAEFIWDIKNATPGDYYFSGDGDPALGCIVSVSQRTPAPSSVGSTCAPLPTTPGSTTVQPALTTTAPAQTATTATPSSSFSVTQLGHTSTTLMSFIIVILLY